MQRDKKPRKTAQSDKPEPTSSLPSEEVDWHTGPGRVGNLSLADAFGDAGRLGATSIRPTLLEEFQFGALMQILADLAKIAHSGSAFNKVEEEIAKRFSSPRTPVDDYLFKPNTDYE